MTRILIIEDDPSLGETLRERLSKDYQVELKNTFQSAWEYVSANRDLDLILFDVGLPDGNGFDLARKIRGISGALFIFLTAQADAESRLEGFELGAEEYIPKPFHLKELLLRVNHVLKAHSPQKEIELPGCTINFTNQTLKTRDGKIEFPAASDMKILQLLVEKAPRVLSRDAIIDAVWGTESNPSHRTIDNIIVRLRQALGPGGEDYIRSVRGVGYQWAYEGEKT